MLVSNEVLDKIHGMLEICRGFVFKSILSTGFGAVNFYRLVAVGQSVQGERHYTRGAVTERPAKVL